MRFLDLFLSLLRRQIVAFDPSEAGVRELLRKLIPWAEDLAKLSPTGIDDQTVAELRRIVEDDAVYAWFYERVTFYATFAQQPVVGSAWEIPASVATQAGNAPAVEAFNPAWIALALEVAKAVAEWLHNHRAA